MKALSGFLNTNSNNNLAYGSMSGRLLSDRNDNTV